MEIRILPNYAEKFNSAYWSPGSYLSKLQKYVDIND